MSYRAAAVLLLVLTLLLVCACGQPTIDATNNETAKESITRIRESLTPEEQKKFDEALPVLMFRSVESLADLAAMAGDIENTKSEMLKELHGKTAQEVIGEGDSRA